MYSLLKPYEAIVDFLGEALGDNVEIALHDLTSPEQEVVALANGHISGRTVGAKLSNLSIHYLETKQYLDNDYVVNYKTAGPDGKLLKAATYFIREEGREMPIGMLCINVNISDLEYIQTTLYKILGIKETTKVEFKRDNPIEILSSPLDEMVDKYIKECLTEMGIPSYVLVERLKVDEKIRVVKYLQAKGTFKVKGAIALVAEKLDVSEPTIYRYLKKM
ncbi:PAS domain-containing protein [Kandleria sp.]|jgi:predicted transcriptional regulator YheO|uniref:helix-turn-helix transcriptional regulator n=1 Tax=Kandleria sp. TaxID=2774291 RepID=UPI001B45899E|nr:PAS domain-containing protein [Kandleria sp.]MBP3276591.1 PAS domain-containing protein [Kandleria sp.]